MATKYIDAVDVSIADSFVDPSNKVESGHGEAKLYVGQRPSPGYIDFFGKPGFKLTARLKKSDMLRFLDEMKPEYFNPSYSYRDSKKLGTLWFERRNLVSALPDENNDFFADEQSHLKGPRGYINSNSHLYQFLRFLPLPNTSRLKIVKIEENGNLIYEFKLLPDYLGFLSRSVDSEIEAEILEEIAADPVAFSVPEKLVVERIVKVRVGQAQFRKGALAENGSTCPFTNVNDPGLLIAGHIKPWAESSDIEKVDPQNGLVFTPTYDRLFNDGLISFEDSRALLISPLLSRETAKALKISPGMVVDVQLLDSKNARRRSYMAYHRENIFRS